MGQNILLPYLRGIKHPFSLGYHPGAVWFWLPYGYISYLEELTLTSRKKNTTVTFREMILQVARYKKSSPSKIESEITTGFFVGRFLDGWVTGHPTSNVDPTKINWWVFVHLDGCIHALAMMISLGMSWKCRNEHLLGY